MAKAGKEGVLSADQPLKTAVFEVVDLLSDSEDVVKSTLEKLIPDQAVRNDEASAAEEGSSSGEYWESESLLEDTFGGMSQEHDGPRCRLCSFFFPAMIFSL